MGRKRSQYWTWIHDIQVDTNYLERHQVPGPDDCTSWDAGRHPQGYGMIGAFRKDGTKIMTTVHRVIARIKYDEPLPSSQYIIHTCGNLNCCNPDHIEKGNRQDIHRYMKINDRYARGWTKKKK